MTRLDELKYASPVFILLSALVNIILAALIIFRLVYHRRHARNALGVEHGSPYTNIITMCVESSSLMVISSGLYTILGFMLVSSDGAYFISDIIPHICVGGLELNNSVSRLRFLIPLGYLPAPHHLSCCSRPRHTPNFTAIRASDGPDSGQRSTFKFFRSRRSVIHCYMFPLFNHFPPLRPINIICNELVANWLPFPS